MGSKLWFRVVDTELPLEGMRRLEWTMETWKRDLSSRGEVALPTEGEEVTRMRRIRVKGGRVFPPFKSSVLAEEEYVRQIIAYISHSPVARRMGGVVEVERIECDRWPDTATSWRWWSEWRVMEYNKTEARCRHRCGTSCYAKDWGRDTGMCNRYLPCPEMGEVRPCSDALAPDDLFSAAYPAKAGQRFSNMIDDRGRERLP
jgi:hypothetical protein